MRGDKVPGGGMAAITENQADYQLSAVDLDAEDLLFAAMVDEYALASGTEGEPRSLNEALKGDDADKWHAAVHTESQ